MLPLLLTLLAAAHADDERYLLGDVGIKIDLPDDWQATRWTDMDLHAERTDGSIKLFVWSTPIQHELAPKELSAWSAAHSKRCKMIKGEPTVTDEALRAVGDHEAARIDIDCDLGGGRVGVLNGATLPVAGRMVHLATFAAKTRANLGAKALHELLERTEVRKPPVPTTDAASFAMPATSTTLPAGWRAPLQPELEALSDAVASLGVDPDAGCWLALKPRTGHDPDLIAACPAGMMLGVVDELTFDDVDATLRERVFKGVDVPAAERLQLEDRLGLLYRPDASGHTLRMAFVPHSEGVARFQALGATEAAIELDDAFHTAVLGSTFDGEHPIAPMTWVSYYLRYQPTSPSVMLPVLLLIGGGAFAGTKLRGRRGASPLDDEEEV